jgi:hypothetical protein
MFDDFVVHYFITLLVFVNFNNGMIAGRLISLSGILGIIKYHLMPL